MAPTSSTPWTSLVLFTFFFFFLFSHPTTSLPLPVINNPGPGLEPRSPITDPRMIPSKAELISQILTKLDMNALTKYNELQSDEDGNNSITIYNSHSDTPTVTSSQNLTLPGQGIVHGEEKGDGNDGEDGEDAAEDTEGFMGSFFEELRKKIKEAIDSSDEVAQR